MKAALIQMESGPEKAVNEAKAFSLLREAAGEAPDVICLPERFLYWGKEPKSGRSSLEDIQKYRDFAVEHDVNLILGSLSMEIPGSDKTTNTSFVINRRGEIEGRYDKKYMYAVNRDDFKTDERDETVPGNSLGLFTLDGVKVGVGICVDLRYPEYFRELTASGAAVVFLPAHFYESTGKTAWEILTRARAVENQIYFCACNAAGKRVCAGSKIIAYDGSVIASLGSEEGVLTAELDLQAQEKYRARLPVLEQMR